MAKKDDLVETWSIDRPLEEITMDMVPCHDQVYARPSKKPRSETPKHSRPKIAQARKKKPGKHKS